MHSIMSAFSIDDIVLWLHCELIFISFYRTSGDVMCLIHEIVWTSFLSSPFIILLFYLFCDFIRIPFKKLNKQIKLVLLLMVDHFILWFCWTDVIFRGRIYQTSDQVDNDDMVYVCMWSRVATRARSSWNYVLDEQARSVTLQQKK